MADCVEAPSVMWDKVYGGPDYDGAYAIVQTSDGGFALAGHTYSFGARSLDFWLVKMNPVVAVKPEPQPAPWIAIAIAATAISGVSILAYLRKVKKRKR